MLQHYVESFVREDPMLHTILPLDTMHYLKAECVDPLTVNMVCVTEWNTPRIKETITETLFNQYYSAVNMAADSDQQLTASPNAPVVMSPNGNKFALAVDDGGNVTAMLM